MADNIFDFGKGITLINSP